MPLGELNEFCCCTEKLRIHLALGEIQLYVTWNILFLMSRPQLEWLPHIKQSQFAATWQACRSWGMRMRANQLIIQNPPTQQGLLILTPACTKSLINECFQLCRRQPIHFYLAFRFCPISTADTECEKESERKTENMQVYASIKKERLGYWLIGSDILSCMLEFSYHFSWIHQ